MLAPMISLASMGWPKFGCLDMYGDARATPYLSAQTRSFLWQAHDKHSLCLRAHPSDIARIRFFINKNDHDQDWR